MKNYLTFTLIALWILILKGTGASAEQSKTQELVLESSFMESDGTSSIARKGSLLVKLVCLGVEGLEFRVEKISEGKSIESGGNAPETFKVQRISTMKDWRTYYAGKDGKEFVLEYRASWPRDQADPSPWKLRYRGADYNTSGKVERSPLLDANDKSLNLSVVFSSIEGGLGSHDLIWYFEPFVTNKDKVDVESRYPYFARLNASFIVTSDIPVEQVVSMIRLMDHVLEIKTRDRLLYMKKLRSEPGIFSDDEIGRTIRERNFRDRNWGNNPDGDFPNEYEVQTLHGDKVIIDHTSMLMWQQYGSSEKMTTDIETQRYIVELNKRPYAGYSDWRLPTIEEMASLIEQRETNGSFVNPIFDMKGSWYGSSDKTENQIVWGVSFASGNVICGGGGNGYIRAVRTLSYR